MPAFIRRAAAHDSARACYFVLALHAACAIANVFCALTGAGAQP